MSAFVSHAFMTTGDVTGEALICGYACQKIAEWFKS
jgi:hypothetical protein